MADEGARASADHSVPGAVEHAYDIAGRPSALRLRDRLDQLAACGTVLVVGGGLTGLEAVTTDARVIPAQVTVWTAGFAVHRIAAIRTESLAATP